MPHLLTLDNKCNREINLLLCLKLFKQSEGDFTSSSDRRKVDSLVCTRDVGVGETMDLPGELLPKKKKRLPYRPEKRWLLFFVIVISGIV